jgi:tRNA-dihydrouridine synthase A
MLGLWNGTPGARRWRQVWSDHRLKNEPVARVAALAQAARGHAVPSDALEMEC